MKGLRESGMYTIIKKVDGTFACEGRIQDGTERWTCPTLEEAIAKMKQHAKFMNGTKIKKKDITFLEIQPVGGWVYAPMKVD